MSAKQYLLGAADRVGSTVVHSFAGTVAALTATGSLGAAHDWKAAGVAALAAGVLAVSQYVASNSKPVAATVQTDVNDVVKAIADKLK